MKDFKTEPGETLEVLPLCPQSADVKLKHYVVRLRHDVGTALVVTQATDHRTAIKNVLEAACAPRSAVVSVQKIKWKGSASAAGSSARQAESSLKNLKYANPATPAEE
jgi:hypothetical protein